MLQVSNKSIQKSYELKIQSKDSSTKPNLVCLLLIINFYQFQTQCSWNILSLVVVEFTERQLILACSLKDKI